MTATALGAPAFGRWAAATLLVVAAVAHVPVTPEHLAEAPYMGVLFVVFIVAATVVAGVLVRGGRAGSRAAAVLCAGAIATYAATRLVPFPMLGDDVGNWGERLGVISLVSEALVVALTVSAMRLPRSARGRLAPCRTP